MLTVYFIMRELAQNSNRHRSRSALDFRRGASLVITIRWAPNGNRDYALLPDQRFV